MFAIRDQDQYIEQNSLGVDNDFKKADTKMIGKIEQLSAFDYLMFTWTYKWCINSKRDV